MSPKEDGLRISELSEATGMPIATLKFYLREGVLHAGEARAKTQASYDQSHADRVKLVRSLTEVGGLSIAATRRVVEAMEDPDLDRLALLSTAQESMAPAVIVPRQQHPLAERLLGELGWHYGRDDRMVDLLERQLEAAVEAEVGLDFGLLVGLARLAHQVAEVDITLVPEDPTMAVRNTVLGTAITDKLLVTLRRLAQTDVAINTFLTESEGEQSESIST